MSFCTKCGREITDETVGCPVCAFQKQEDDTQTENMDYNKINQLSQDSNTKQSYQDGANNINNNQPYQGGTWNQANNQIQSINYIQTPIRVMSIALIVLTGGIGMIVSLICGSIMMKNDIEEYRKFGQLITIISVVRLAIFCCLHGYFLFIWFLRLLSNG